MLFNQAHGGTRWRAPVPPWKRQIIKEIKQWNEEKSQCIFLESYQLKIETFLLWFCITTYAYKYCPWNIVSQAVTPMRLLWENGRPEMRELFILDGEAVTVDLERDRKRMNTN